MKRSVDHADQQGSRGGKRVKTPRETLKSAFHIRLTSQKVEDEKWITGSLDHKDCGPPGLLEVLQTRFPRGSINFEVGKNGQPHFQCTVFTRKGKRERRSAVRAYLEEHYDELKWPVLDYCEPCTNVFASDTYTQKSETAVCSPWVWGVCVRTLSIDDLPEPYGWQKTILDRYEPEAPVFNANIHWYYDERGQIGKTMMGRMMVMKRGFYIISGGKEKMRHLCAKNATRGYFLNITREEQEHLSYAGLEQVSDQIFADTFSSDMHGMVCRKGAHIVVFANFSPNHAQISSSRWRIYKFNYEKDDFDEPFIPSSTVDT